MFMISIHDAFCLSLSKIQESEHNCAIFVMNVCGGKFWREIRAFNGTCHWIETY